MDASTILPAQPESYRQLIRRSLMLYRASFKKVIWLASFLALIIFIPRFIAVFDHDIFYAKPLFSWQRLWLVLTNLLGLMVFIAIFWRLYCFTHGLKEPLMQDVKIGLKKVLNVFVASLIQSLIVFAAIVVVYGIQILLTQYNIISFNGTLRILLTACIFFMQFLALLYVAALFFFLIPLIVIENKSVLTSLETSALLAWNHWWRVISTQLTPWLVYLVVLIVIKNVLRINVHFYFVPSNSNSLWITLVNLVLFALFIPWVAAILLVQMRDLELRKNIPHNL